MLGVESPTTDHDPTSPVESVLVVIVFVPSVIVTVAPPTRPCGPVTTPLSCPCPADIVTFSGLVAAAVAESTM